MTRTHPMPIGSLGQRSESLADHLVLLLCNETLMLPDHTNTNDDFWPARGCGGSLDMCYHHFHIMDHYIKPCTSNSTGFEAGDSAQTAISKALLSSSDHLSAGNGNGNFQLAVWSSLSNSHMRRAKFQNLSTLRWKCECSCSFSAENLSTGQLASWPWPFLERLNGLVLVCISGVTYIICILIHEHQYYQLYLDPNHYQSNSFWSLNRLWAWIWIYKYCHKYFVILYKIFS